jgi:hypothetical protein
MGLPEIGDSRITSSANICLGGYPTYKQYKSLPTSQMMVEQEMIEEGDAKVMMMADDIMLETLGHQIKNPSARRCWCQMAAGRAILCEWLVSTGINNKGAVS